MPPVVALVLASLCLAPPAPAPITPATPIVAPAPAQTPAPAGILGAWSGAVSVQAVELKVSVTFTGDAAKPAGTIDIPQQSAMGLPLTNITIDGDKVAFTIAEIPGNPTFTGVLKGDEITGTFSQGAAQFPFTLKRGEAPKALRPQAPRPPFPYAEEAVSVQSGDAKLAGTLTRPPGDGPFPAVILVSGSGPQNRDEELFGHKPFAVLADHLTRGGIIVLRYDDRGVAESTGPVDGDVSANARDAEAWVAQLASRKDVSAVGMIGHSEGGLIAPMVAARNKGVAFVVMLAGPGVNGAETLIEQNRALALSAGATHAAAELIAARAREAFAAMAAGANDEDVRAEVRALSEAQAGAPIPDSPELEAILSAQLAALRAPWFREFLTHDPAPSLRTLTVPVLALNGDKDVQVVATQQVPAITAAFKEGKNADATVRVLPGLNHLFQRCTTGGIQEYGQIEETMDPAALDLIRDWITSRFEKK